MYVVDVSVVGGNGYSIWLLIPGCRIQGAGQAELCIGMAPRPAKPAKSSLLPRPREVDMHTIREPEIVAQ